MRGYAQRSPQVRNDRHRVFIIGGCVRVCTCTSSPGLPEQGREVTERPVVPTGSWELKLGGAGRTGQEAPVSFGFLVSPLNF